MNRDLVKYKIKGQSMQGKTQCTSQ